MSIEHNLAAMELSREAYWLRYPGTSPFKLRRRALTVRHCLHVMRAKRFSNWAPAAVSGRST